MALGPASRPEPAGGCNQGCADVATDMRWRLLRSWPRPSACLQMLSQEIAAYLGLELGQIKIKRFADGEIYVQVRGGESRKVGLAGRLCMGHMSLAPPPSAPTCSPPDAPLSARRPCPLPQVQESIRGCDVFLVQPSCPPVNDNLMELLVMIDACRRASARSITAVLPYYGYARADRKTQGRESIAAKLTANLITQVGAGGLVVVGCVARRSHAPAPAPLVPAPLP